MTRIRTLAEQQFGAHAAAYATSAVHAKGASLQRMVELTAPRADWRALDVATGAGHTAAAFAPHVASVVAGDLTAEMLEQAALLARERGLANMTTARIDAARLPFPDASFDVVTCRIAAHHFPDPQAFAREVARVLVPGGLLALVDNVAPDAVTSPGATEAEIGAAAGAYNAFEALRDPSHVRALPLGEWLALLRHAGLTPRDAELMRKDMQLGDWARRLGCEPARIARLSAMLDEAPPTLRAFLAPQMDANDAVFTLTEAIIVAVRA